MVNRNGREILKVMPNTGAHVFKGLIIFAHSAASAHFAIAI